MRACEDCPLVRGPGNTGRRLRSDEPAEHPQRPESPSSSASTPPEPTPAPVFDNPVVAGRFRIGRDGTTLAIRCWGTGRPVVVLEGAAEKVASAGGRATR
jgi:hypothetical protein